MTGPGFRASVTVWAMGATLVLACSTLAPVPEPSSCSRDEDCDDEELCGNGVCYAAELPPRSDVGLDVRITLPTSEFRVELRAEDRSVVRIDRTPIRYSVSMNNSTMVPGVRDMLQLRVRETFPIGGTPDTRDITASLDVSQASRLSRDALTLTNRRFEALEGSDNPTLNIPWAFYHGADPMAELPLLVTLNPEDGLDPVTMLMVRRAPVYRQMIRRRLDAAAIHEFSLDTRRECHRLIRGNVLVGAGKAPASSVNIEFLHGRRPPSDAPTCDPEPETGIPALCSPQTLIPNAQPECEVVTGCEPPYGCYPSPSGDGSRQCGCTSDDECPIGQVCEVTSQRCALDLADRGATRPGIGPQDGATDYDAWVYTYCEGKLESDLELDYVVRATPRVTSNEAVSYSLTYRTAIDFTYTNGMRPPATADSVCLPDWAAPQTLAFEVNSPPQDLYTDSEGRPWTCCSTACLTAAANPNTPIAPPTPPSACRLAGTITARTLFAPDEDQWKQYNCMPLAATDPTLPDNTQRVSYVFERPACGQSESLCDIALSSGSGSLGYDLRIEPPDGSLIRSMAVPEPFVVTADTTSLTLPELEYRVLLRGQVILGDDPGCVREVAPDEPPSKPCELAAEVMVERLRDGEDEASTAFAPFFYSTKTITTASRNVDAVDFALAVNPGIYLVTAIPQSRTDGGPAKIQVVDLRLNSPLVKMQGPLPTATLKGPLVLEKGHLTIVELDGFDRNNTTAVPIDIGSWAGRLQHPTTNAVLDLNNPLTCYGPSNRACTIRRLRSGLGPNQEQFIRYVSRRWND